MKSKIKCNLCGPNEFWWHGGQFEIEIDCGEHYQEIIVPIHRDPDDEDYEQAKKEAEAIAEKIVEAMVQTMALDPKVVEELSKDSTTRAEAERRR